LSIPINAASNCINISNPGSVTGGAATFQLAPGRYVASLIKNNMACRSLDVTKACDINTVIIQGVDNGLTADTARWGLSVKTPTVVQVFGPTSASFVAFVIDDGCSDNTGGATLLIQQAR